MCDERHGALPAASRFEFTGVCVEINPLSTVKAETTNVSTMVIRIKV